MTQDHDFKARVRARMEKTGESYTTARRHLEGQAPPGDPTRFDMPSPEPALDSARTMTVALLTSSGVEIAGDAVHVWMGEPRGFDMTIPRTSIVRVERLPDREGGSLGIHGSRGRWLVNTAYTDLVRFTLEPPVRAAITVAATLPADAVNKMPRFVRLLMRDRSPRVKQLTVSVADALVAALTG